MDRLSAIVRSGRNVGDRLWDVVPSKSVLSGFAIAAVSGAALFAVGQRLYINFRTKRVVQKDENPKHLFVLVPGYLGSPSQMQYVLNQPRIFICFIHVPTTSIKKIWPPHYTCPHPVSKYIAIR